METRTPGAGDWGNGLAPLGRDGLGVEGYKVARRRFCLTPASRGATPGQRRCPRLLAEGSG